MYGFTPFQATVNQRHLGQLVRNLDVDLFGQHGLGDVPAWRLGDWRGAFQSTSRPASWPSWAAEVPHDRDRGVARGVIVLKEARLQIVDRRALDLVDGPDDAVIIRGAAWDRTCHTARAGPHAVGAKFSYLWRRSLETTSRCVFRQLDGVQRVEQVPHAIRLEPQCRGQRVC